MSWGFELWFVAENSLSLLRGWNYSWAPIRRVGWLVRPVAEILTPGKIYEPFPSQGPYSFIHISSRFFPDNNIVFVGENQMIILGIVETRKMFRDDYLRKQFIIFDLYQIRNLCLTSGK